MKFPTYGAPLSCLALACSAAPADVDGACFDLPGTATQALSVPARPTPYEEGQGRTLQGTVSQGRVSQGRVSQGNVNQGRNEQGAELTLSALNGARLSLTQGGLPLPLQRGVLIAPEPLLGASLAVSTADGQELTARIDQIVVRGDLAYYGLSTAGNAVCNEGELGLFLPGAWNAEADHVDVPGAVTYACESGVIAKCAAWGYAPWLVDEAYHATCTRLARADYCGDGQSWTREHTLINLYDVIDIQASDPSPSFSFEAAWGPDGAVCVDDSRYVVTDASDTRLLPPCWAQLARCNSLDEPAAAGALLANESEHTPIVACVR